MLIQAVPVVTMLVQKMLVEALFVDAILARGMLVKAMFVQAVRVGDCSWRQRSRRQCAY
jgi:hypothetical protein